MSGFDMTSISVVEPGHKDYEQLDVHEQVRSRHQSTSFYNEVMEVYNDSPVGAILIIPLPDHIRYFNLRNVFKGRGVIVDEDVLISRQQTDEEGNLLPRESRPAKVKKLTEKQGRIVDMVFLLEQD